MRFSVYFDCILNEKNGSFHIEIMISAAQMLGPGHATLREIFYKMCNLMRFGKYLVRFCIKIVFSK